MRATKIKMLPGYYYSSDLQEIDQIYIEGCRNPGYFKKEVLHEYLQENPGKIQVDIYPYPNLIPATSRNGEKYVRSTRNEYTHDNLLDLPRK